MSADTAELLEHLRRLDIRLKLDGGRLTVNAPEGVLTAPLREELARRRDEVKAWLAGRAAGAARLPPPLAAVPRTPRLPVSHTQQRLWFIKQMDPGSHVYNVTSALRLSGRLDEGALQRALAGLMARHESLRTRFFAVDGEPHCAVEPHVEPALERIDLGHLEPQRRERAALDAVTAFSRRPIDIMRAPLLQCLLVRIAADDHALVFVIDHIIADGLSLGILLEDFGVLYAQHCGAPLPELPALPLQYIDYAEWERQAFAQGVLEDHLAYWKQQLAGLPELATLPADQPRPAVQGSRGARQVMQLPVELAAQLKALARDEGATLFMVLLSAFQVLLQRHAGGTDLHDLPVGSAIANRGRAEMRRVIGFFANNIVLRGDLSGNPTLRELIARNRELALGAYAHQDMPFDMLVDALETRRALDHSPLFQVLFVLQNLSLTGFDLPGLRCEQIELAVDTARFDLAVDVFDIAIGLRVYFEYSTDLFDAATIERLMDHFRRLLQAMVDCPSQRIADLPLLGGEERDALLVEWNRTDAPYPSDRTVHSLFEAQAKRRPEAPALCFEGRTLSYAELNAAANRVAHLLRSLGVAPGALVGVSLERSVEMIVALLGVLKAGAAYVPLDPAFPQDRIDYMVADAKLAVVLTQESLAAAPLAGQPSDDPAPRAGPDGLAYVIYTSGSTGRPKGVMLEHRSVVNFLASMQREPGLREGERFVSVTTLSFDIAGLEIHGPLSSGGTVVLASRATALDGRALAALLERERADLLQATPATWRLLLDSGWRGRAGLKMLCGGEALPRELAQRLLALGGELWNLYGPTETTIWSTAWRVTDASRAIPIGRPIANTQCYVLDERHQPVPIGVGGELCIGGDGLARGYLGREELTAEKFVTIELPGLGKRRVYRTGDVVRWRANGALEYVGRRDHQVKLRGYRIELGEIEAVLATQAGVRDNAVQVREDTPGDERLVAYVVAAEGAAPDTEALRTALREKLPEYMVPNRFVLLAALPLTPNGKVDRKALPAPAEAVLDEHRAQEPMTPLQEQVAQRWSEVLQITRVGLDDNFFSLGGHSLLLVRLQAALQSAFEREIPLLALFQSPTVRQMSALVEHAGAAAEPEQIAPVPRDRPLPVSLMQERLWLFDQLEPGSTAYHIQAGWSLRGTLDAAALGRALDDLVQRHEMLRTRFEHDDGGLRQVVLAPQAAPLTFVDLDADAQDDAAAMDTLRGLAGQPFDLARGPLWRVVLLRRAPGRHWLVLTLHHTAADGWATELLARELAALYEARRAGRAAALAPLTIQYADYAAWQRDRIASGALAEAMAYWKAQLAGAPAALDLPLDRPRPALQRFEGALGSRQLPAGLRDRLVALGQGEGATLFIVLLAAFKVILARHAGQDDLCVGLPVAGRDRAQLQGLAGVFINTVVLRSRLEPGMDFAALLRQVTRNFHAAYAHQDVPFDALVAELGAGRDASRTPLFQVMVNMQNFDAGAPPRFDGLDTEPIHPADLGAVQSKFDLTLYLRDDPAGLTLALVYNAALFDAARIEQLLAQYLQLLQAVAEAPQRDIKAISLVTQEAAALLPDPAQPLRAPRGEAVHVQVTRHAQRAPDRAAAVDAAGALSYGEIDRLSNRLANHLAAQGIEREDVVAIHAERSVALPWALLGVLKAGAAFMLVDPAQPAARSAQCLRLARPRAWLRLDSDDEPLPPALEDVLDELAPRVRASWSGPGAADWRRCPDTPPAREVDADDLAYIAFTSGTTGEPKAIAGSHAPLTHFFEWHGRRWGLGPDERFSALSGLAHDPLLRDVLGALWLGATVCLPDTERLGYAGYLAQWMRRLDISVSHLTPAMAELLAGAEPGEAVAPLPALRHVFCGGDVLRAATVETLRVLAPAATLVNFYGATETPQAMGWYEVPREAAPALPAPLGRGIDDVQLLVLNAAGQLAGIGELGEIHMRTPYLARGYLHDAAGTAQRFVSAPGAVDVQDRMYRSGDLGRYRADGLVEFAGRRDAQVKLRGFRIELGEIEAALRRLAGLADAAVVLHDDGMREPLLVAFVVPAPGAAAGGAEAWRASLRRQLPEYMVPAQFVALERLPLTPNGKLDRRALPAPAPRTHERVAPRGATQVAIAAIWAEVLNEPDIGADDDFFALGGHSLMATRVLTRLRARLGVELPLRTLFDAPSVAGLARAVDKARSARPSDLPEREDISI